MHALDVPFKAGLGRGNVVALGAGEVPHPLVDVPHVLGQVVPQVGPVAALRAHVPEVMQYSITTWLMASHLFLRWAAKLTFVCSNPYYLHTI